ncbi:hypothetical protein GCM10010909_02690 [Acidocella aquatica]|uniref:Aromatic-ring-hydroxylating dioxygenase subunit beta n=1 Tax=Acidocella aquatica TaxID=1922313 RepID=A0ABQ6A1B0_9PROT|nr:aromatic-ring-hydroxylating dioxygenase subunit beta [Acidocella aquatica]GLR65591.1 hypothetical protein GCM10010909_02690 [Acidocella aquatica]
MSEASLRQEIEQLLYLEADYADDWQLTSWLGLWAEGELLYEVGPLDTPRGDRLSHNQVLYLLSDDRFRLEQRVIRMGKPTAHAEAPVRSQTRHNYTHLRNIAVDGDVITFKVNMLVTRTRRDNEGVAILPGYVLFTLARQNGALKIQRKRIFLDLWVLSNPGTMSIIL